MKVRDDHRGIIKRPHLPKIFFAKLASFTKPSNNFSGNVLKLVTGTTLAQSLGILISPIITRLFAPEAYGVVALFLSITAILGVIVCLRYELAIMLPGTHEEAANVLAVALCSVVLVTTLSALIVVCGGDLIVHLMKAPELKRYLWLIPVVVFFQGLFSALNYWNTRTRHFGRLSVIQIASSVATQATKLTAGLAGFVSGGGFSLEQACWGLWFHPVRLQGKSGETIKSYS